MHGGSSEHLEPVYKAVVPVVVCSSPSLTPPVPLNTSDSDGAHTGTIAAKKAGASTPAGQIRQGGRGVHHVILSSDTFQQSPMVLAIH